MERIVGSDLQRKRPGGRAGAGVLAGYCVAGCALLLLGFAGVLSGNAMRYLMQICLYAAAGEAWNLLSGFGGLTSLGQQLYVGLSGYAVAIVTTLWGRHFGLGLFLGVCASALAALLLSLLFMRMSGVHFSIATWISAEAAMLLMLNWNYVNKGAGLFIDISPYPTTREIFMMAMVLNLLSVLCVYWLLRSRAGFALLALRDEKDAAAAIGINPAFYKTLGMLISAVVIALAGGLFFLDKGSIYPESGFGIGWTISLVLIVSIGGSGTVAGPLLGAILFVLLSEYLANYQGWSNIILGVITIVVILFFPKGIVGTAKELLERRARRCFPSPEARAEHIRKRR